MTPGIGIPVDTATSAVPSNETIDLGGKAWRPTPPVVFEEIDISEHLLTDIAMRHVYLRGTCTIHLLSDLMKLSLELTEALFRKLIDQQYLEVRRMAGEDY